MRLPAKTTFTSKSDIRTMVFSLALGIIFSMISCASLYACEVMSVSSLKAASTQSGPFETNAVMCEGPFWLEVKWLSAGGSQSDKWQNNWIVEIWEPGTANGPYNEDYHPTSGPGNTMIKSVTLPWNIDPQNPVTGSSKTATIEITTLAAGTHTLRAWVKRVGTSWPRLWEYSPTCTADLIDIELTGDDDVILGEQFTVTVDTGSSWSGTGYISLDIGTAYSSTNRTEKYWDTSHNLLTTSAYNHEFGVKLPSPATVAITSP